MTIQIIQEQQKHFAEISNVIQQAFLAEEISNHQEQYVVQKLRASDAYMPSLSLVALDGEKVIGHMMLSKVHIVEGEQRVPSLALAPLSVHPNYQRQGIGTRLMHEALKRAKELPYEFIIVLGHPDYYQRFGFQKASDWHIKAPFPVPDEAFMALPLTPNARQHVRGTVHYSTAFL